MHESLTPMVVYLKLPLKTSDNRPKPSGQQQSDDFLCIYFFIPRFQYMKFTYSLFQQSDRVRQTITCENSRHFATSLLVSPRNDDGLRNERRNSILMTRHYLDPGGASDWLKQISLATRSVRSTTQVWVVLRYQYRISVLVSQARKTITLIAVYFFAVKGNKQFLVQAKQLLMQYLVS